MLAYDGDDAIDVQSLVRADTAVNILGQ